MKGSIATHTSPYLLKFSCVAGFDCSYVSMLPDVTAAGTTLLA